MAKPKKERPRVTAEALATAARELQQRPVGFFTVAGLAEALGLDYTLTRAMLELSGDRFEQLKPGRWQVKTGEAPGRPVPRAGGWRLDVHRLRLERRGGQGHPARPASPAAFGGGVTMKLTRAEREDLRRRLAELEKRLLPGREALAPVEAARKGPFAEALARVVGEPGA